MRASGARRYRWTICFDAVADHAARTGAEYALFGAESPVVATPQTDVSGSGGWSWPARRPDESGVPSGSGAHECARHGFIASCISSRGRRRH
jgi:hypothetical protein